MRQHLCMIFLVRPDAVISCCARSFDHSNGRFFCCSGFVKAPQLDIREQFRYNSEITEIFSLRYERNTEMEEKKTLLTYAGLKKLEEELHELKVNKRQEVAQKIKEAREQGDLSENAEYDAAKDEQRDIEARIEEIEKILKNVEVVVEDEVDVDKINVGCKVKVHDFEYDEDMEFRIVGSTEANSLQGKISNESPVGKALIGAGVGDIVEVEMPIGIMKYEVLEIERQ